MISQAQNPSAQDPFGLSFWYLWLLSRIFSVTTTTIRASTDAQATTMAYVSYQLIGVRGRAIGTTPEWAAFAALSPKAYSLTPQRLSYQVAIVVFDCASHFDAHPNSSSALQTQLAPSVIHP